MKTKNENSFLANLATSLFDQFGEDLSDQKIVFPNKRAGLFFNEDIKSHIKQPIWSPAIMSFEDLVRAHSPLSVPDKLTLTFKLHEVFQKQSPFKENFEQFYFWGDLLIKDFNDVDQYMADAKPLFANLAEWKALSVANDYLTAEQVELIEQFWSNFEQRPSEAKAQFRKTWDILYTVYSKFKEALLSEGQGYLGMLYRTVAEQLEKSNMSFEHKLIFAGFNALTTAEERIISYAIKEKEAQIFWDLDAYYASSDKSFQEAGNFFRMYNKHPVLGKTFPDELPARIANLKTEVNLVEVSGNIGQAKLLGANLQNAALKTPEKTAVIMGDESLLFSVLHAIPERVEKVNVTMGYPLKFAPIFNLVNSCLYLQKNKRAVKHALDFNHRDVVKILKHPLVSLSDPQKIKDQIKKIEDRNMVRIAQADLISELPTFFEIIFIDGSQNYFGYLKSIILTLYPEDDESVSIGFFNELHSHVARLEQIVDEFKLVLSIDALIRLLNKIVQSVRVPFSGEPLRGLQLMGVLESRNLDFEEVHLLSMNEDNFPAKGNTQSFIPYNIRKAYGLPTMDQNDAIYAYLFYRLFHQAKKINIYYNSEGSNGKGGELSRFVKQLVFEAGDTAIQLNHKVLAASGKVQHPLEISIEKNDEIKRQLKAYSRKGDRKLSASAIKIYLDCRLKFYYKYLAGLQEAEEVSEELDAATFGNILHNTLEDLYNPFIQGAALEAESIEALKGQHLNNILDQRFAEEYGSNAKDFKFEGRNIIARDILLKIIRKMLDVDKLVAPLKILELEQKNEYLHAQRVGSDLTVYMDAKIDRLDQVGDVVRVIDYKSGGDKVEFPDIPSLFDRDHKKRNGAAMQTLFYSYLYYKKKGAKLGVAIQPGLYAGKQIFHTDFNEKLVIKPAKTEQLIKNAVPYMEAFEEELNKVLVELFLSNQPFNQTEDVDKCKWCPYSTICHR